jgi:hypothetical protein
VKRSLRRHIESAVNRTWTTGHRFDRGTVGVALLFPRDAFAGAPTWTPGPGFHALNNDGPTNTTFLRDNGDGTQTVVVPGLHAEGASKDGGPWTEDEVWTVTAPVDDFDGCGLGNAAHGITAMRQVPGAVVVREDYATHPLAAVDAYWREFERAWGFVPSGEHRDQGWPFGQDRAWAYFICRPDTAWDSDNEAALLEVTVKIARHFGAKARVYPYSLAAREVTGPLGNTYYETHIGTVYRRLHPDG